MLINKSSGEILLTRLHLAVNFKERLRGLLFTREFPPYEGLLLKPCNGVHTFFMRYAIDVLLLDENNRVLYKKIMLAPNRLTPFLYRSRAALEFPGGSLLQKNISLGDELMLVSSNMDQEDEQDQALERGA